MDSRIVTKRWRTLVLVLGISFGLQQSVGFAQQRTWTDSSGTYKLEAKLVEVLETADGLQAQFVKDDGKQMAILVSKLCETDAALATKFFNESKSDPATKSTTVAAAMPPKSTEAAKPPKKETSTKTGLAVEQITSRPIGAPIDIATDKLNNRNTTIINFDPSTALRLEREIKRDEKGRPTENPIYTVDLDDSELTFLPQKFRAIVDALRDPELPIDAKRRAIESLRTSWPQGRHGGLLKALVNAMSHKDKFLRLAALDLLANHDSDQSLIYILARIDDTSFDVRWRAFEILTQLRDPRVIPELCERLGSPDRAKASSVLHVFGEASLPLVQEWIKVDGDEDVLLTVSQLLGNIGNQDTISALKVLENHKSLLVRSQAKNSIKQLTRRFEQRAANSNSTR